MTTWSRMTAEAAKAPTRLPPDCDTPPVRRARTTGGQDLTYALRACPRTAINSQRSPPAATREHEASAGFQPASSALWHPRNA